MPDTLFMAGPLTWNDKPIKKKRLNSKNFSEIQRFDDSILSFFKIPCTLKAK